MGVHLLAQFQDLLYAQDRWALLLIFQAMDAAGKEEQKKRFLQRLEKPDKNWKFSANDIRERAYWDDYMKAYEDTIRHTATERAPWYVVPADNKWFTRVVVAAAVVEALDSLGLHYPEVSDAARKDLEKAREDL